LISNLLELDYIAERRLACYTFTTDRAGRVWSGLIGTARHGRRPLPLVLRSVAVLVKSTCHASHHHATIPARAAHNNHRSAARFSRILGDTRIERPVRDGHVP
jgi:hypothetical protein